MIPVLMALGIILTMFGLWQLDWAFWVDKIDAFSEYFHGFDLGWAYLLMMLSFPIAELTAILTGLWIFIHIGLGLFGLGQILMVWKHKTAPLTWKIFWWKLGTKSVSL